MPHWLLQDHLFCKNYPMPYGGPVGEHYNHKCPVDLFRVAESYQHTFLRQSESKENQTKQQKSADKIKHYSGTYVMDEQKHDVHNLVENKPKSDKKKSGNFIQKLGRRLRKLKNGGKTKVQKIYY